MLYERFIRPFLFLQDPEKVHARALLLGRLLGSNALTRGCVRLMYGYDHAALKQTICGISFPNPVGLAAGFDKDAVLMHILPSIGFGFEEVGSVTLHPYGGNDGTRLKRLPQDESIIVYYGLKNEGIEKISQKLQKQFAIPIGVSVAKTNRDHASLQEKLDDWVSCLERAQTLGAYLTINLSCPNTYDTTNWCEPHMLEQLLNHIVQRKVSFTKPVFLKLSADLKVQDIDEILSLARKHKYIKGFILSNLVKERGSLSLKSKKSEYDSFKGGLSGKVVKKKALNLVRHFYAQAGDEFVLIGCGGIFTADDAYDFIANGASLVQLATGMIYRGPGVIKEINKGLVELCEFHGFTTISEARGSVKK